VPLAFGDGGRLLDAHVLRRRYQLYCTRGPGAPLLPEMPDKLGDAPSEDLIPFTVPEVRRLLSKLIWNRPANPTAVLDWSTWRQRHQARAKRSHYAAHHLPPEVRL